MRIYKIAKTFPLLINRLPPVSLTAKELSFWNWALSGEEDALQDERFINNPNDIFMGETPTQEILIFNKEFQKVFSKI